MKKEIAILGTGIAIAVGVFYLELNPTNQAPAQVTSVSSASNQPTSSTPTTPSLRGGLGSGENEGSEDD
jgi:hypothetical protein